MTKSLEHIPRHFSMIWTIFGRGLYEIDDCLAAMEDLILRINLME